MLLDCHKPSTATYSYFAWRNTTRCAMLWKNSIESLASATPRLGGQKVSRCDQRTTRAEFIISHISPPSYCILRLLHITPGEMRTPPETQWVGRTERSRHRPLSAAPCPNYAADAQHQQMKRSTRKPRTVLVFSRTHPRSIENSYIITGDYGKHWQAHFPSLLWPRVRILWD